MPQRFNERERQMRGIIRSLASQLGAVVTLPVVTPAVKNTSLELSRAAVEFVDAGYGRRAHDDDDA